MGIGKLCSAGSVVMWPLLGLSVVAIAFMIEQVCLSDYRDRSL